MRILVTGGAGFIGSALCRHLVEQTAHEVVCLDALTYAATEGATSMLAGHPQYRFVRADICDGETVARVFAEHTPDAVANLAAETHVDRSITGPAAFVRSNVLGVQVMLEVAREYWSTLPADRRDRFRFLQVSTDEVFGSLGPDGLFTEESPYDPSSPYSASKAAGDHLARAWRRTYGLPTMVSNCSNNFGPFQLPEKLIPLMILNAVEGRPLPVYGDGLNVRDWLFVDDHARALTDILERGASGATYNVGGRSERTNLQVVEAICDLVDQMAPPLDRPRRSLISFTRDRPGHDRRYAIDSARIESQLGWRPAAGFEENLGATVRWYLDNRAWWGPLREHAGQRLGLLGEG